MGLTTGLVVIAPPLAGLTPSNYTLVLTPVGGGSPVVVTCTTPAGCRISGLQPGTTYTVSGNSNMPDGSTVPLNTDTLTTLDAPACWVRCAHLPLSPVNAGYCIGEISMRVMPLQGSNNNGEFGNGVTSASFVLPTNKSVTQWDKLSQSTNFACGIAAGRLLCWGAETGQGNLGRGAAPIDTSSPNEVIGGGVWTDVFTDYFNACGIRANGSLLCWVRCGG